MNDYQTIFKNQLEKNPPLVESSIDQLVSDISEIYLRDIQQSTDQKLIDNLNNHRARFAKHVGSKRLFYVLVDKKVDTISCLSAFENELNKLDDCTFLRYTYTTNNIPIFERGV